MPNGMVVMSVYLFDDQGLDADNIDIINGILRYSGLLNIPGMDWDDCSLADPEDSLYPDNTD